VKSLGKTLQEARENLGQTCEEVAEGSNISLNYIRSMELEDFSVFPSETYLMGFLRSYASYLDLSPNMIFELYNQYKRAEEPIPMQHLMAKDRSYFKLWIILPIATFLFLFLYMGFYFYTKSHPKEILKQTNESNTSNIHDQLEISNQKIYIFDENSDILREPFYVNDIFVVKIKDLSYQVVLKEYNNNEAYLNIQSTDQSNEQVITVPFGQSVNYLLTGSTTELSINLEAIKEDDKLILTMKRVDNQPSLLNAPDTKKEINTLLNVRPTFQVLLAVKSPHRLDLNIRFTGTTNFRYFLDNKSSDERFYQNDEYLQLNMNNKFQLWASNAGNIRFKVGQREIMLGTDGQIVVKNLRWIFNNTTGMYELILEDA
jgi:cytoskeleton protein RodZ